MNKSRAKKPTEKNQFNIILDKITEMVADDNGRGLSRAEVLLHVLPDIKKIPGDANRADMTIKIINIIKDLIEEPNVNRWKRIDGKQFPYISPRFPSYPNHYPTTTPSFPTHPPYYPSAPFSPSVNPKKPRKSPQYGNGINLKDFPNIFFKNKRKKFKKDC